MGIPSSFNPSIWNCSASTIFFSTSCSVLPVATQAMSIWSRDAPKLFGTQSIKISTFFIINLFPTCLFPYTVEQKLIQNITLFTIHRYGSGFYRMVQLPMVSTGPHNKPSVLFEQVQDLSHTIPSHFNNSQRYKIIYQFPNYTLVLLQISIFTSMIANLSIHKITKAKNFSFC